MKSGSLAKRLHREIKNSPQKAGVLVLLAVVAVYFWAPLVMGMFSKPAPARPANEVASSITKTSDETPNASPVAVDQTLDDWQQLNAWMTNDRHMTTAEMTTRLRDPSAAPIEPIAAGELARDAVAEMYVAGKETIISLWESVIPDVNREVAATVVQPVNPAEAGLALTSSIVGSRKRVALISGKAYFEGSFVRGREGYENTLFEVVRINPKSVVLRNEGQDFELKIVPTELAQKQP